MKGVNEGPQQTKTMKKNSLCAAVPLADRACLENQPPCPSGAGHPPVRSSHLPECSWPRPALARFLLAAALLCSWSPGLAQTITNSVINFPITACTMTKGSGRMAVPVQRQTNVNSVVSVSLATTAGTAIDGIDYIGTNALLTFQAGETQCVVHIPILNDGTVADKKAFNLLLSNPTEGAVFGARTNIKVTIANNNSGLHFYLPAVSINEDDGQVVIKVARGDYGDKRVSVDYATTNGTAKAGQDYTATAGTLSFAPGEVVKSFTVPILNDYLPEPGKTFKVVLSNPTGGAVLAPPNTMPTVMTVTINDTDQIVWFEFPQYSVREESPFVEVGILRGENNSDATVDLATNDSTAKAGRDYTGVTNTVRFGAGERRKIIRVPILDNNIKNSTKSFAIRLINPTGGAILPSVKSVIVNIIDNDPGLRFATNRYSFWHGAGFANIPVLRSGGDQQSSSTVDFQTADSTAKVGLDYQAVAGTLKFEANEAIKNITIPILLNPAATNTTSFRLKLSNPSNGTVLDSSTASTMVDVIHQQNGFWPVIPPMDAKLKSKLEEGVYAMSWDDAGLLQHAGQVYGPWEDVSEASSPYATRPASAAGFYRIQTARPTSVYVPARYDGHTPLPLILALHSALSEDLSYLFPLDSLAESKGFLLSYPQGITPTGSGGCWWNSADFMQGSGANADDSGYLRSVIEQICRQFVVDPKRIYVFGLWTGGQMAHRVAYDHADLVAGIASVLGATAYNPKDCHPAQPVNVLEVNSSDTFGGYSIDFEITGEVPGAVRTAQIWAELNGSRDPVVDAVPSFIYKSGTIGADTTVLRYTQCPPGGAVEFWSVKSADFDTLVYYSTSNLRARLIDWLLAHPKP